MFIFYSDLMKYFLPELDLHKKKIRWNRGSNGYSAKVPKYIADVAELIEMDPDPYFEGVRFSSYIFQYCLFH